MTGLVRRATLITAAGLLAATAVMAGVPSATTSTQPLGISLVGKTVGVPGTADPTAFGAANYTIRDASNNPVPGSVVIMNFSACTDVRLCSAAQPGTMTVNCGSKTVSGVTDAAGLVSFRIVGGGLTSGAAVLVPCISVTADGVPLNTIRSSTFDENGAGGLTLADVTLAKNDVGLNNGRTRTDFNKSGTLTLADVTLIKNVLGAAGSPASCAPDNPYCL
jgi:hypothetical protein